MSHRKYYKKGLNLSAVQTLLRPHALYSGDAVKPASSHSRHNWGQASSAGRARGSGGGSRGRQGSARRPAASEVSARQQQPASFDAGSRGQRLSLLRAGSSLRLSHLQSFCSRNASAPAAGGHPCVAPACAASRLRTWRSGCPGPQNPPSLGSASSSPKSNTSSSRGLRSSGTRSV